jgi:Arc/MetJ-type ribon-helix-helix transcriptional regulator
MYDDHMTRKLRLSASVDHDLLDAGNAAVAEGRAESLSAWVNDALRLKAEHDQRMQALDEFLTAYEATHGEITEDEMKDAARRARARATVVRGAPATTRQQPRRPRGAA